MMNLTRVINFQFGESAHAHMGPGVKKLLQCVSRAFTANTNLTTFLVYPEAGVGLPQCHK